MIGLCGVYWAILDTLAMDPIVLSRGRWLCVERLDWGVLVQRFLMRKKRDVRRRIEQVEALGRTPNHGASTSARKAIAILAHASLKPEMLSLKMQELRGPSKRDHGQMPSSSDETHDEPDRAWPVPRHWSLR